MVPGIGVRMARNSRVLPITILIIPNVPLVPARNTALVSPDESHVAEELVDVKLQGLGRPEVISVKINVVGKVMQPGDNRLIVIRHALRRGGADQMVIP